MSREYKIVWNANDVRTLRPDWSEEECLEWLDSNWSHIEDRCVELGWEVIECLLPAKNEIFNSYPKGECPDCGEPIPVSVVPGDECINCGHVFNEQREDD